MGKVHFLLIKEAATRHRGDGRDGTGILAVTGPGARLGFGKIRRKPFELGFAYQFLLFLQNPLPSVLFLQIYLFFS